MTSHGRVANTGPDLNRARRDDELSMAEETVSDLIVVGGGVTGAGIAVDAASRGLSVTLIEARDLAYGTSRWSSKLVHGGLRYLAHGDFPVAWESARERHHLMTVIAPHLIRPLPHVLVHPTDQSRSRDALVRVGLTGADSLRRLAGTSRGVLPGARSMSTPTITDLVPAVSPAHIKGGVGYWDGQLIDDARLVIALARTAAAHGGRILTRVRATHIARDGVTVHDTLRGGTHHLRARSVILAVGIWSGEWDSTLPMRLSRGTHVLIRPEALGNPRVALTVPVTEGKSRYVFALPNVDGPIIAGLTDVAADHASPDDTTAPRDEIEWVLTHLSTVLRAPLRAEDVVGAYAGYRPLVETSQDHPARPNSSQRHHLENATADISRRHLIHRRRDGVVIVTGGKLTTYRRMAADAIDALDIDSAPCRTRSLPLVGARMADPRAIGQRIIDARHRPHGNLARYETRYGDEARRIAALATEPDLAGSLDGTIELDIAEIAHFIRHEGALTVDDIMQRRTRMSVQPHIAALMRPQVAAVARMIDPDVVDIEVDT